MGPTRKNYYPNPLIQIYWAECQLPRDSAMPDTDFDKKLDETRSGVAVHQCGGNCHSRQWVDPDDAVRLAERIAELEAELTRLRAERK